MGHDCEPNDHLIHYIRKYVNKQVYQVQSEIVEYMKNHNKAVHLLGGSYVKKSQLSWNDYVKRVCTADSIVEEFMICMLSHMYEFYTGLILKMVKFGQPIKLMRWNLSKCRWHVPEHMFIILQFLHHHQLSLARKKMSYLLIFQSHHQSRKRRKVKRKLKSRKVKRKMKSYLPRRGKEQRRVRRAGKHRRSQNHHVI